MRLFLPIRPAEPATATDRIPPSQNQDVLAWSAVRRLFSDHFNCRPLFCIPTMLVRYVDGVDERYRHRICESSRFCFTDKASNILAATIRRGLPEPDGPKSIPNHIRQALNFVRRRSTL